MSKLHVTASGAIVRTILGTKYFLGTFLEAWMLLAFYCYSINIDVSCVEIRCIQYLDLYFYFLSNIVVDSNLPISHP